MDNVLSFQPFVVYTTVLFGIPTILLLLLFAIRFRSIPDLSALSCLGGALGLLQVVPDSPQPILISEFLVMPIRVIPPVESPFLAGMFLFMALFMAYVSCMIAYNDYLAAGRKNSAEYREVHSEPTSQ